MGTTLSVNIFFASDPDLDNIPNLESDDIVAWLTNSAEDIKLKRIVALKFLPPELTQDKEVIKRFTQEAQTAASLDHPNICTVFEIDEAEGVYENAKEESNPKSHAEMWVALIKSVRGISQARIGKVSEPKPLTPEVNETESPPVESPTEMPPPPPTEELFATKESNVARLRQHLEDVAEKRDAEGHGRTLLLGQIVYAIQEARPDRYGDIPVVIDKIAEYPELPDNYSWELDKVVTLSGGQKFFDYAMQPDKVTTEQPWFGKLIYTSLP